MSESSDESYQSDILENEPEVLEESEESEEEAAPPSPVLKKKGKGGRSKAKNT